VHTEDRQPARQLGEDGARRDVCRADKERCGPCREEHHDPQQDVVRTQLRRVQFTLLGRDAVKEPKDPALSVTPAEGRNWSVTRVGTGEVGG
jgi:hypothetical protein